MAEPHEELAALDPQIAQLIEAIDPKEVLGRVVDRDRDRFVALCRIIVGQQVSTAAARTIWGRVEDEFGGPPTPEQLVEPDAEERLRACGLSGRKASYAIGVAEAIVAEELLLDELDAMDDEQVIEVVVALRGLGRWSAEMFLMFDLDRPDVFSGGDLGLRRGIQIAYELDEMPTPEEAVAIAERWSPHRTLASLYLWEAVHANPR
jgi:DNA-3-methyladenine glycosylase II